MAKKKKSAPAKAQAQQKLRVAITTEQDANFLAVRNRFIDKFTLCDLTCKAILEYYKKAKKREGEEIKCVLDMRVIPFAFSWANIEVKRNVLNLIFGGSKSFKKRGSKSAKKLRDGIVHAMNADDLQELVARQAELTAAMDAYLELFDPQNNQSE